MTTDPLLARIAELEKRVRDLEARPGTARSRKRASAMVAKIPLPLSRHIGATYRPAFLEPVK